MQVDHIDIKEMTLLKLSDYIDIKEMIPLKVSGYGKPIVLGVLTRFACVLPLITFLFPIIMNSYSPNSTPSSSPSTPSPSLLPICAPKP